jgi:plastocyanin
VPAETLVMTDNAFQPQTWEIAEPGTFTVENQGQGLHNLTIDAAGIDVDVQPGDAQEVEIDLDPGEYDMVCEYHIAQGMTGTVVVTET